MDIVTVRWLGYPVQIENAYTPRRVVDFGDTFQIEREAAERNSYMEIVAEPAPPEQPAVATGDTSTPAPARKAGS